MCVVCRQWQSDNHFSPGWPFLLQKQDFKGKVIPSTRYYYSLLLLLKYYTVPYIPTYLPNIDHCKKQQTTLLKTNLGTWTISGSIYGEVVALQEV